MKKLHPLAFAALTLPLILAACGNATSTPTASSELVGLTLNSGLQNIKAMGLPSNGATSAVTFIKVNVKDSNGNLVSFDGNNVYKVGGAQSFITLTDSTPTAKVLLPKGTYSFESVGKDSQDGTFLAYGMDSNKDLSAPNPSVVLRLHTLMSQDNSTLTSKLPVNSVNTTDELDLRLAVRTPGMALNVPLSDYTVTYNNDDMTILNSSKLGANVQVKGLANQTAVGLTATVNGWVDNGNETASLQSRPVRFTVPLSSTGLNTDTTPPTATMDYVAADTNTVMTLSGTANDDMGVSSIQVYDGSVLVGSTSSAEAVNGVTQITTSGTNWAFSWTSGATAPEMTVIVTDTAGNQTTATPAPMPPMQVYIAPAGVRGEYYPALITLQPGESTTFQSDFSQNQNLTQYYQGLIATQYHDGNSSYDNLDAALSITTVDAVTGASVDHNSAGFWIYHNDDNGQAVKWTVKNVQSTPISFYFRYYIY